MKKKFTEQKNQILKSQKLQGQDHKRLQDEMMSSDEEDRQEECSSYMDEDGEMQKQLQQSQQSELNMIKNQGIQSQMYPSLQYEQTTNKNNNNPISKNKQQSQSLNPKTFPIQQYKQISLGLKQQNISLKNDLTLLRNKVTQLKNKQSQKQQQNLSKQKIIKNHPKTQLKALKQQLKSKYQHLNVLQNKTKLSLSNKLITITAKQQLNKLNQLNYQLQKQANKLNDELNTSKKLKKQLKIYDKTNTKKGQQILLLKQDNQYLKTQTFLTKQLLANLQYSVVNLHQFNIVKNKPKRINTEIHQLRKNKILINENQTIAKGFSRQKLSKILTQKINSIKNEYGNINKDGQKQKRILSVKSQHRAKTQMSMSHEKMKLKRELSVRNGGQNSLLDKKHKINIKSGQIYQLSQFQRKRNSFRVKTSMNVMGDAQNVLKSERKQESILKSKRQSFSKKSQNIEQWPQLKMKKQNLRVFAQQSRKDSKIQLNCKVDQFQSLSFEQIKIKSKEIIYRIEQFLQRIKKQLPIQISQKSQKSQQQLPTQNKLPLNNNIRQKILLHKQLLSKLDSIRQQHQMLMDIKQQLDRQLLQKLKVKQQDKSIQSGNLQQQLKQNVLKGKRENQDKQSQTQHMLSISLMKGDNNSFQLNFYQDSIGEFNTQQQCHFDHRMYLTKYKLKLKINQMIIYHSDKGIHGLQPRYQMIHTNGSKLNQMQKYQRVQQILEHINNQSSHFINPNIKQLLAKRQLTQSFMCLSLNDNLKKIKLLYNTQDKFIAKIQFISNNGVKYQYGNKNLSFPTVFKPNLNITNNLSDQQKQQKNTKINQQRYQPNVKYYQFDILPKQFPSYFYGNYTVIKDKPFLSSLGAVIFQQQ